MQNETSTQPFRFGDLPRELRDEIYKQTLNCTHQYEEVITAHWITKNLLGSGEDMSTTGKISASAIPNGALLLVNHQMNQEYSEALERHFSAAHVHFDLKIPPNQVGPSMYHSLERFRPIRGDALRTLRLAQDITMRFDVQFEPEIYWADWDELLRLVFVPFEALVYLEDATAQPTMKSHPWRVLNVGLRVSPADRRHIQKLRSDIPYLADHVLLGVFRDDGFHPTHSDSVLHPLSTCVQISVEGSGYEIKFFEKNKEYHYQVSDF